MREPDLVESTVYAAVHDDYVTSGLAGEHLYTKKESPFDADRKTNTLNDSGPEGLTVFDPLTGQ